MNPSDNLHAIVEEEEKTEEKEIAICARLVFTQEQCKCSIFKKLSMMLTILVARLYRSFKTKMDGINISITTAQLTELDVRQSLKVECEEDYKTGDVTARFNFTRAQEDDLREAFNLLDRNGEGRIKAEDFRVAIKALGYTPSIEELQQMITAVDKGATGKLSFENFETAIMRKIMALDSDVDIMKSFRLFDMDDCGYISFDNVKKVTQILGIYLTDEEIEEMMDDADKDMDGLISVQEFMKMIKNCVHIVTL